MERHCSNAMAVAEYLSTNNLVEQVHYVGLPSHPDHAIANRQMKHPGH
jgi:methionine-gamma-lyase